MFRRLGLETNLEKTMTMVCTPGFVLHKWGEQAYKQQASGEGLTFWERKRLRVSYTECGMAVAQSYLKKHMASLHGIYVPQTRGVNEKW